MSSETPKPSWNTTSLWAILALFLVLGTAGAATFVYGALGLLSGSLWSVVPLVLGAFVAMLALLFMAGILYRVDRYRGANQRRVEFFE